MIKLAFLVLAPLLAAIFCAEMAPDSSLSSAPPVGNIDREFLADWEARENEIARRTAQVDRALLEGLEEPEVRVAIPVRTAEPIPVKAALPVRAQAVQVARAEPVRSAVTTMEEARTEMPVRRAVPVAPRRATIRIYRGEVIHMPAVAAN